MLNFLFKGLGGLARDTIELADSAYETTKEIIVDTGDTIANIPDLIAEGYSKGLISDGDNQPTYNPEDTATQTTQQGKSQGFPNPSNES